MEEVSSLDSFGADPSARPESETSKLDEDNSTENIDKQTDLQDTPASPPAEEDARGADADLATVSNAPEATAADADEDFEQISEGSLDVVESQSEEKQEAAASDEQDHVSKESEKAQTVPEADGEPEPAAEEEQEHYNIDNSRDAETLQQRDAFENVEAADEGAAGDTDAVDGAPASMEAMDVDDAESEAQTEPSKDVGTEAATEADDVEMRSEGGDSQQAVGDDNEDGNNTADADKNAASRDEGIDEVDRSEEQDQDASASNENDEGNEDEDGEGEAEPMEDGADGETEQLDEGAEAEHGDGT